MGLFSNKQRDHELDRVDSYARSQLADGQQKFEVAVNLLETRGGRAGANTLIEAAKLRLQEAGLTVVAVSVEDRTYTATISVRRSAAVASRSRDRDGSVHWPNAQTFRTEQVKDRVFDSLERSISPGWRLGSGDPEIELVMTPVGLLRRQSQDWEEPYGMLLTAGLLLVGRDAPRHGRSVDTHAWERYDFSGYQVRGRSRTTAGYVVVARHDRDADVIFVFGSQAEAEALGAYFQSG